MVIVGFILGYFEFAITFLNVHYPLSMYIFIQLTYSLYMLVLSLYMLVMILRGGPGNRTPEMQIISNGCPPAAAKCELRLAEPHDSM